VWKKRKHIKTEILMKVLLLMVKKKEKGYKYIKMVISMKVILKEEKNRRKINLLKWKGI